MKDAASRTGWSGVTVWTSRVITSLTFMIALQFWETRPFEMNAWYAPFRSLRQALDRAITQFGGRQSPVDGGNYADSGRLSRDQIAPTTTEPSPTDDATRLTEPARTSPTAKMPQCDVS